VDDPILIVLIVIGVGLVLYAAAAIKIVSQFEKGLIERFGRFSKMVDPGLRFIVPFIDRIRRVDMREQVVDVPPQEVITKDNVVVTVDAVVYDQATDPVKLKYNVANFILAATKLAQTNLRNIVGDMDLDDALTSRERINAQLREILDEATDVWGTKVVRVEIQRIDPPPDVTEAMHRQMKAERDRRGSSRPRVRPRPSRRSPRPRSSRSSPWPRVRPRPSSGCSAPSTPVTRPPT
jgi:regulator of protease activity HflC (stomatin/prohibitin superfamily)